MPLFDSQEKLLNKRLHMNFKSVISCNERTTEQKYSHYSSEHAKLASYSYLSLLFSTRPECLMLSSGPPIRVPPRPPPTDKRTDQLTVAKQNLKNAPMNEWTLFDPRGKGTRYILGWGGAARPLLP